MILTASGYYPHATDINLTSFFRDPYKFVADFSQCSLWPKPRTTTLEKQQVEPAQSAYAAAEELLQGNANATSSRG